MNIDCGHNWKYYKISICEGPEAKTLTESRLSMNRDNGQLCKHDRQCASGYCKFTMLMATCDDKPEKKLNLKSILSSLK